MEEKENEKAEGDVAIGIDLGTTNRFVLQSRTAASVVDLIPLTVVSEFGKAAMSQSSQTSLGIAQHPPLSPSGVMNGWWGKLLLIKR